MLEGRLIGEVSLRLTSPRVSPRANRLWRVGSRGASLRWVLLLPPQGDVAAPTMTAKVTNAETEPPVAAQERLGVGIRRHAGADV